MPRGRVVDDLHLSAVRRRRDEADLRAGPPRGTYVDLVDASGSGNVGYRESTLLGMRVPEGRTRKSIPVRFNGDGDQTRTFSDMRAGTSCSVVRTTAVMVRALDSDRLAVQSVTFLPRIAPAETVTSRLQLIPPHAPPVRPWRCTGAVPAARVHRLRLTATVPPGARYVDLPLRTRVNHTGQLAAGQIQAHLSGSTADGYLAVLPSDLWISADFMKGYTSSRQRISLGGPAPAGGAVVRLSDTRPDIGYPATVTVPAGQYTTTLRVATAHPRGSGTVTALWDGRTTTTTIRSP